MNDKINTCQQLIRKLNLVGSDTIDYRVNEIFLKKFLSNNLAGNHAPFLNPHIKYLNNKWHLFNLKTFMFRAFDQEMHGDPDNVCIQNVYGFRSKNFIKDEEFLAAGCSVTYGIGVPQDKVWAAQLAKKYNLSYSNLGVPGDSVQGIVLNIFAYIKKFGAPKHLFCLFPSFDRMNYPMNSDWSKIWGSTIEPERNALEDQPHWKFRIVDLGKEIKKYIKLPTDYADIIPADLAFSESVSYIHMLEQYCSALNINFKWSTWDLDTRLLIEEVTPFENYITVEMNQDDCVRHESDGTWFWEKGMDRKFGQPHPGSHLHLHFAESFERYLV